MASKIIDHAINRALALTAEDDKLRRETARRRKETGLEMQGLALATAAESALTATALLPILLDKIARGYSLEERIAVAAYLDQAATIGEFEGEVLERVRATGRKLRGA